MLIQASNKETNSKRGGGLGGCFPVGKEMVVSYKQSVLFVME